MPSVAQFSSESVVGAWGRKSLRKTKFCSVVNLKSFTVVESVFTAFCNKQHHILLRSGLEGMTAWSSSSRICYPVLQGNPQGKLDSQSGPSNQNC